MSRTPDDRDADLERFAADLRALHLRAGQPGHKELGRRCGLGRTTLSAALNGRRLPSWGTTRAVVLALDGDEHEWRRRWADLAGRPAAVDPPAPEPAEDDPDATPPADPVAVTDASVSPVGVPGTTSAAPPPVPAPRVGRPRFPARWLAGVAAVVAVLVTVVAVTGGRSAPLDPRPGPRPGPADTCWQVAAHDVRVFQGPHGEESWSTWPRDTLFWGAGDDAVPTRLRVALRRGGPAWVTADANWVRAASGCA